LSDYRPISCIAHERLEFAALKRQWLEVSVDGFPRRLLPLDVYARDGEEWLKAESTTGEIVTIRLDRLSL
jgi:Rho-binding antiterminator